MAGVTQQKFEAFWMRLNGHDPCVGPKLMAHDSETSDMGTDVQYRSNIVGPKDIDLVFVLEYRICKLSTGRLDEEIATIDLVAR
jgi:hypothetical protein